MFNFVKKYFAIFGEIIFLTEVIVVHTFVKDKLQKLSLSGIPKAVAQATANYIDSLEKQLLFYKRAEAQGRLLILPAAIGDRYYTKTGEATFTSVEQIVSLFPEIDKTIFLKKAKKEAASTSYYVSRTQLDDEKVSELRQSDKEYYILHKDEVNKKDRDKYHMLHPNARYYKKRSKPDGE